MPTLIKNSHVLDPKERIIKLGEELSKDSDFSAVLNKKDGVYVLSVSSSTGDSFDVPIGNKIPPDTPSPAKPVNPNTAPNPSMPNINIIVNHPNE